MRWDLVILAIAITILGTVSAQETEKGPVRIYLFTAPSKGGFVDADSKDRADAVQDVLKVLGKKKTVIVVGQADKAEVTLEITRRGWELANGTFLGSKPIYNDNRVSQEGLVRATLTVGDYSTDFVGRGGHMAGMWSNAAGDLASKVDKWIKDNSARIPRK